MPAVDRLCLGIPPGEVSPRVKDSVLGQKRLSVHCHLSSAFCMPTTLY
jgi:hypothetical protein